MFIKLLILLAVGGISLLLALGLQGARGLEGAAAGILLGAGLLSLGHLFLRWARRAQGQAILAAMLGSALASFLVIVVYMVVIAYLWREILVSSTLTALALYLAGRFCEAFQAVRPPRRDDDGAGANPAVKENLLREAHP